MKLLQNFREVYSDKDKSKINGKGYEYHKLESYHIFEKLSDKTLLPIILGRLLRLINNVSDEVDNNATRTFYESGG